MRGRGDCYGLLRTTQINYLAAELTRYSVEASLLNAAELRSIYSFVPSSLGRHVRKRPRRSSLAGIKDKKTYRAGIIQEK